MLFTGVYGEESCIGRNPKPSVRRHFQISDRRHIITFRKIALFIYQLSSGNIGHDDTLAKRRSPDSSILIFHDVEDTIVLGTYPSFPRLVEYITIDTHSLIESKGKLVGSQVVIIIASRLGTYHEAPTAERINTADGIRQGIVAMRLGISIPCLHLRLRTNGIDTGILTSHPNVTLMVAHDGSQQFTIRLHL